VKIAAFGILLMEMLQRAVPVAFLVQFRVVGKAEENGPANDGFRNN
jgi:hypothetical protein